MIRAATGKPSSKQKPDELKPRPSSASGKLQSFSYVNLKDHKRPLTSKPKITASPTPVNFSKPSNESAFVKTRPRFERRLTVGKVDGLAKHAKTLTRLNTPSSSKIKIKIEERITLEQLNKIKTAFEEADTDGSGTLDIEEFKFVVKTCLNVTGHNEDPIVALFMKIDSSSDGEIDWDEFCTYMQLEYAEKEDSLLRSKQLHFILPAHSVSASHHKSPIFRLLFFSDNTYLCAGQDGLLTFWSTNLKLKRSKSILDSAEKSNVFTVKPSVWVTDVAVLPSHGKILVATGGKEIHFYELLTFEFYCVIVGLESVPLMMNVVSLDDDQAFITFGDNQGCVSVMTFVTLGDTLKSWKKMPKVKGVPTVTLFDVASGGDTSFVRWRVHNDWVTGLKYFHELRSVISSSNESATAVVRGSTVASTVLENIKGNQTGKASPTLKGDKRKQVTLAPQNRQSADQSVFHVYKGVKAFDFCKDTNILATGGMDRIVRLWNPYVPQKPTALLRGHNSPITFIAIAGEDKRLFSVSIDKYVKVWDLVEQDCLVSVNPKLHKISGELISCVYADSCKTIAMATDQLSLLRISPKGGGGMPRGIALRIKQAQLAGDMPVSHSETVTCCAFNKYFNHVITCSDNSVVKLWDFESGNFMSEFNKAHGDSAITAVTFDTSGRRLITAGRDGAVRIWNYNNGHCLRSLERVNDNREVSSILYIMMNNNKFIAAVGWDHRVNIFPDETDYLHHVQRPFPHWPDDLRSGHTEDIVAIAYGSPNLLATASYEGLIIVWNLISGHSISKLPFPRECFDSDSDGEDMDFLEVGDSPGDNKAVNKILFINNRLAGKNYSSLIAGCSDGSVIFWNIHTRKAFARFVNMKRSRSLTAMAISEEGDDLYVANDLGYVTAWDIEDYALRPTAKLPHGVACPRRSHPPRRVTSWRAHIQPITCLELIDDHDVVMTSSIDHTVRMWSTKGAFIGTLGQKSPWDIYEPSTWCHPMVPPEVLVDSQSMPEHSVIKDKYTMSEVIHTDTPAQSDSDDELDAEEKTSENRDESVKKAKKKAVSISSKRRSSAATSWSSSSVSGDAWRKKLSRRLSRNILSVNSMMKDEEEVMLDEVRKSMQSSAGKRLRQEKLLAQQRARYVTDDVSARAFKSLHYYELAYPASDVTKPNPRAHLDDVFLIAEEEA